MGKKMGKQQFFVHNNVKLASSVDERCRYAFVDSKEHRADRILMGSLIPTAFETVESEAEHEEFEIRVCSFKSRYESWFLCCMSDLEWVLQVEGNYVKACEKLLGASVVIRSELSRLAKQNERDRLNESSVGLQFLNLRPVDAGH